jgi:periplasmic divalent cation tolerance protein
MPTAYITAPPTDAEQLAELLVEERLAACVNQVSCDSVFRWDGEVVHEQEVVLLAKTTDDAYHELVARVEEVHPYEVPCIERFDETEVLPSFAAWREDSVGEETG